MTFCGSEVEVKWDDKVSGKEGFRMYEDGLFKQKDIVSFHPNVLRGVIIGKKSWGLWVDQWSDGIVECSFTLQEIVQEFEDRNIKIPESLFKDFQNRILQKKVKRNEMEIERIRSLKVL